MIYLSNVVTCVGKDCIFEMTEGEAGMQLDCKYAVAYPGIYTMTALPISHTGTEQTPPHTEALYDYPIISHFPWFLPFM